MDARPRLAIVFDAVEERWPSMEFVAEMLLLHLQKEHGDRYETRAVRPRFFGLFESVPGLSTQKAWNADRLVTRFVTYPTQLAAARRGYRLFHVADHSYAHVAHVLPAERTGIYCHDLDAFACLLHPNGTVAAWRKAMARTQLRGLQRAALVFYSTEQVRQQIDEAGILDPARLVHAPYGVAPDFFSDEGAGELPEGALPSRPFLLHVGSSVPRKRIDVLFRVFAQVRKRFPELVLIQQGAQLLQHQRSLVAELGIGDAIIQPPRLSRPALAALYHRAELVLLTSEREGFGLPILEALAGGAAVVASDIPPFREVAAEAVSYCPVGDVELWAETIVSLLERPELRPTPEVRRGVAQRYTWTAHAATIANAYARLAGGPAGTA
jgi:glycosyltransferase involved in cell wall biosynthesis